MHCLFSHPQQCGDNSYFPAGEEGGTEKVSGLLKVAGGFTGVPEFHQGFPLPVPPAVGTGTQGAGQGQPQNCSRMQRQPPPHPLSHTVRVGSGGGAQPPDKAAAGQRGVAVAHMCFGPRCSVSFLTLILSHVPLCCPLKRGAHFS